MNKKTPGVTPDESHMCEEVLEGHSPGHVVLGDHNGHKPYEYLECGEKKPRKCKEHGETFRFPQCFNKQEGLTLKGSPTNVSSVIKTLDLSILFKIIREFTLETNTMNISGQENLQESQ